ncbi:hypothetical protein ACWD3Z_33320 [Streptomyces sp. NPDC002740]
MSRSFWSSADAGEEVAITKTGTNSAARSTRASPRTSMPWRDPPPPWPAQAGSRATAVIVPFIVSPLLVALVSVLTSLMP